MACRKALWLCVVAIAACGGDPSSWPKRKFDSSEWVRTQETKRYVFVRDLMANHILDLKTKLEVKAILGAPSSDDPEDYAISYIVKEGGEGFDQIKILDIRFNSGTGRVEKVFIRGD